MDIDTPFVVAAPAHPSLDGAIHRFCDGLRTETRPVGTRGATAAVLSCAFVRRLALPGGRIKLAAVVDGEVVGVARIDETGPDGPELLVGVAAHWRRQGVALTLCRAVVSRAHAAGVPRIVVRTSRRGKELRDLGADLGFRVFDLGGGRVDLVRTVGPAAQSA